MGSGRVVVGVCEEMKDMLACLPKRIKQFYFPSKISAHQSLFGSKNLSISMLDYANHLDTFHLLKHLYNLTLLCLVNLCQTNEDRRLNLSSNAFFWRIYCELFRKINTHLSLCCGQSSLSKARTRYTSCISLILSRSSFQREYRMPFVSTKMVYKLQNN